MKGTGRWTIQEAAERSTAAPTMAAALDARYISGRKAEREAAAKVLKGPSSIPKVPKEQLVEDMKAALFCSKICSYAQVCVFCIPKDHRVLTCWSTANTRGHKAWLVVLNRRSGIELHLLTPFLFFARCSYTAR